MTALPSRVPCSPEPIARVGTRLLTWQLDISKNDINGRPLLLQSVLRLASIVGLNDPIATVTEVISDDGPREYVAIHYQDRFGLLGRLHLAEPSTKNSVP